MPNVSFPPARRSMLAPLFDDVRPSYLIDAILQQGLGQAWADDAQHPRACLLRLGELVFVGGDAAATQAALWMQSLQPILGVWPPASSWSPLLETIPASRLIEQPRWSMSSASLDGNHLEMLAGKPPQGLAVAPIDLALARRTPADLQTDNQILNFGSAERFLAQGFGLALLEDGRLVAAISTFAICQRGVEIQINVHPDYRRRGLATWLGARFAVDCLERGLDPHWDAGNPASVALATRLGYTSPEEYNMPVVVPD